MHQALPVDRLRAALAAWELQDADILELKPGATADVFLVLADGDRWVAKYNYDHRDYFEAGLKVSQAVARAGTPFEVSVPIETASGTLTELIEWPPGNEHPLAVLSFVGGDPLSGDDPQMPVVLGDVCGRVHAALLEVEAADVGMAVPSDERDDSHPDRDAGDFGWLHDVGRELERRAREERGRVRHTVAVWDGPDIRRKDEAVGLIDFGHCGWHPLVHVVANRSLNAALRDRRRLPPFLAAVERHLQLTGDEHELFTLYRLLNAAIYARWVAAEKIARRDPMFTDGWFRDLLGVLERELPDVGMNVPATDGAIART